MNGGARFGAELDRTGVTFRLWAPAAKRVEVMLDRAHPMQAQAHGWYQTTIPQARPGTLYKYRIDGEMEEVVRKLEEGADPDALEEQLGTDQSGEGERGDETAGPAPGPAAGAKERGNRPRARRGPPVRDPILYDYD